MDYNETCFYYRDHRGISDATYECIADMMDEMVEEISDDFKEQFGSDYVKQLQNETINLDCELRTRRFYVMWESGKEFIADIVIKDLGDDVYDRLVKLGNE